MRLIRVWRGKDADDWRAAVDEANGPILHPESEGWRWDEDSETWWKPDATKPPGEPGGRNKPLPQ